MGIVYLGRTRGGRPVAVKVIRPEYADDPDFRIRFRREVQAASRVLGLCTARVVDADPDAERPYLVTEFIAGPPLDRYVSIHGRLAGDQLWAFAIGVAEALVAIHSAGVVHRDLKPSNLLLASDGPRVIDFGIASAIDATSVTRTGISVGTPAWMAPEQVRGEAATSASDVFGWGALIAFAATGRPPFGVGPPDAVLYRLIHEAPALDGVPTSIRSLVDPALAKDPSSRPSAKQLLSALLPHTTVVDDTPEVTAEVSDALHRTWQVTASLDTPAPKGRPTRRSLAIAAAVVVVAIIALMVVLLQHGRSPSADRATHSPPVGTTPAGVPSTGSPARSTPSPGVHVGGPNTPVQAARTLFQAWERGDRSAALSAATPHVVSEVFANTYSPADQGMDAVTECVPLQGVKYSCGAVFGPANTAALIVSPSGDAYKVVAVRWGE
jgi:serine/threonine protein kinase